MNKQILGALMTTLVAGTLSSTAMADNHDKGAKANGKAKSGTTTAGTDHAAAAKDAAGFWCLNQTCKGHSACAGNGNASCHGKNECKGKGILEAADEAACKTAGGRWAAKK